MPVKMKPTSTIKKNLGIEPNGAVQKFFTQRCAEYMDKYVPYDTGYLARDTRIIEDDKVIYNAPYAHYMYEGKLYVDPDTGSSWAKKDATKIATDIDLIYHTAGTGHHWDRRMVSADMGKVVRDVKRFIKRGGK